MTDLDVYHRLIGYLRGKGLDEAQAYHQAEELMETPIVTFNVRTKDVFEEGRTR
jgi:hypothetical protein